MGAGSVLRHSRGLIFTLACLSVMASGHNESKAQSSTDHSAALADINTVPGLGGATDDTERSSKGRVVYSVAGRLADTNTALVKPSPAATEDDLIVEEFGGLPVPKRHAMAEGTKNPFRRDERQCAARSQHGARFPSPRARQAELE